MMQVAYFKRQAKNLHRDYKTKTPYVDDHGFSSYKYNPKYYDIESVLFDYECNEDDFCLMRAQHIIALMSGFYKWTDLLKASEPELELAKALLDNQDKIDIDSWQMYIAGVERDNKTTFDPESRLEILKHVFLNVEGEPLYPSHHRLNPALDRVTEDKKR